MLSRSAIAELKAIIAAFNNVQHPARRHLVRIVINRKDAPVDVAADAERIPEAGRDAAQLLAVGAAPEDVPAIALAGEAHAIGADQLVRCAKVFAHAKEEVAPGIEAESRKTVVRII